LEDAAVIRIRVSTLEAYRRVMQTDFMTEAELVAYVKAGQENPYTAWQAAAGTAWHLLLAAPVARLCDHIHDNDGMLYEAGGFVFNGDDVHRAREHVGPGLCEQTRRRTFAVDGLGVQVQGTCDRIRGLHVRDAKCKFTPPDPADYEPSLQWRAYLLLNDAVCFTYDLFPMKEPTEKNGNLCALKDIISFNFWAYPGMEADVLYWVREFVSWARSRDLLKFLDRAGAARTAVGGRR
jgi:hypothetical protein